MMSEATPSRECFIGGEGERLLSDISLHTVIGRTSLFYTCVRTSYFIEIPSNRKQSR